MTRPTTLEFPTILLPGDFQLVSQTQHFEINTVYITLSGLFTDADIELAVNGFEALVLHTSQSYHLLLE